AASKSTAKPPGPLENFYCTFAKIPRCARRSAASWSSSRVIDFPACRPVALAISWLLYRWDPVAATDARRSLPDCGDSNALAGAGEGRIESIAGTANGGLRKLVENDVE